MALFNCMYFILSPQVFLENRQHPTLATRASIESLSSSPNSRLMLVNQKASRSSYSSQRNLFLAAESVYRFSKSQQDHSSLINDLIHKYWEQTIFLSASSPTSNLYIDQLTKQESLISKQMRRKLLITFSKALLNGHVDSNTMIDHGHNQKRDAHYIQYKWRKVFHIALPYNLKEIFNARHNLNFPTSSQNSLLEQLKDNRLPIFVVTNSLRQLVASEPASQAMSKRSINDNLSQWYGSLFPNSRSNVSCNESWFFINPKDANEYRDHIISQYGRSAKQNGLITIASGIDFYYRLNRSASNRVEFRLFPDLNEVGKIITDKKHRQNLVFDKKQNVGRSYFQGQPIYFIEPVLCSKTNSSQKVLVKYSYNTSDTAKKYNAVFLNKDTALLAWQNFYKEMKEYNLPTQPTLRVYNLEDFLKDIEFTNKVEYSNFLFIPGHDAYYSIQNKYNYITGMTTLQAISEPLLPYVFTSKLWLQRTIWSLTSRQPPSW